MTLKQQKDHISLETVLEESRREPAEGTGVGSCDLVRSRHGHGRKLQRAADARPCGRVGQHARNGRWLLRLARCGAAHVPSESASSQVPTCFASHAKTFIGNPSSRTCAVGAREIARDRGGPRPRWLCPPHPAPPRRASQRREEGVSRSRVVEVRLAPPARQPLEEGGKLPSEPAVMATPGQPAAARWASCVRPELRCLQACS